MKELRDNEICRDKGEIARRDVLKAAAALAGTSMLGLAAGKSFAFGGQKGGRTLGIAYWNGERFLEAGTFERGDETLADVVLNLRGYGQNNPLASLEAVATVPEGKTLLQVPFKAWTAPPTGAARTRFQMPVSPTGGLDLRAAVRGKGGDEWVGLRLIAGGGAGPKLFAGTYVVLAQPADWTRYRLDGVDASPLRWADGSAVETPYLLIDVERV